MAKTQAWLANGKTITVDNSQIDIKFTRSVDQLNNSLSKAQHSLGLYYDNQSRLVDVLGRCVEGLSLSQIKLGMWVDETGRARTVSGGYAEGLSKTQLELGYYADKLGNVFDRQSALIGRTKEAIKADEARNDVNFVLSITSAYAFTENRTNFHVRSVRNKRRARIDGTSRRAKAARIAGGWVANVRAS